MLPFREKRGREREREKNASEPKKDIVVVFFPGNPPFFLFLFSRGGKWQVSIFGSKRS
jgi:hypothetical protein